MIAMLFIMILKKVKHNKQKRLLRTPSSDKIKYEKETNLLLELQ
jgi:hypothetical protein